MSFEFVAGQFAQQLMSGTSYNTTENGITLVAENVSTMERTH